MINLFSKWFIFVCCTIQVQLIFLIKLYSKPTYENDLEGNRQCFYISKALLFFSYESMIHAEIIDMY
ncbi:hypothetical protein V7005_15385, partial [Bacillus pseudomycoides]